MCIINLHIGERLKEIIRMLKVIGEKIKEAIFGKEPQGIPVDMTWDPQKPKIKSVVMPDENLSFNDTFRHINKELNETMNINH